MTVQRLQNVQQIQYNVILIDVKLLRNTDKASTDVAILYINIVSYILH